MQRFNLAEMISSKVSFFIHPIQSYLTQFLKFCLKHSNKKEVYKSNLSFKFSPRKYLRMRNFEEEQILRLCGDYNTILHD